ncbi:phage tail assembly chaperone [Azospirillum baldaniorum]|uniref:tail fiber assembly protein n=1 Tax=Azospirillum baldaniorum TaxID=1064539 RepID=UPI0011AA0A91|nr:tail fiber assembly protein [Azospirillum baldaniorum]TWA69746.1 phage tail assembly chaperone [Azospirillum baldaniorum]
MARYYAASTGGFYDADRHGRAIPADAMAISEADFAAVMAGQGAGKQIVPGPDGRPMLADPPAPTDGEMAAIVRAERDRRLDAVAWRISRHERETRLGQVPTDDLAALDGYMQALADVPEQAGFPHAVVWPTEP